MKQSFDVKGGPQIGRQNLPLLRAEMAKQGLDGFYIPHEDEYQNEYLPTANERLAWVSGFTGSFGSAFVFTDMAVMFLDGRYTIQGADQTDNTLFDRVAVPDPGPFGWLADQNLKGKTIGYDPAVMTPNDVDTMCTSATRAGATLKAVTTNPIDAAWTSRPPQPTAIVYPHALEYAGQAAEDKRAIVADTLNNDRVDAAVITAPASLAWLFNIRGGDVACSPLPLGRAIIRNDGSADLFLDPAKVTPELRSHLGNQVTLHPYDDLESRLGDLKGQKVSLDPALASAWFFQTLDGAGATIVRKPDPVMLPKAKKNAVELSGTAAAHRRDGAALVKFLHWLDTDAQSGKVTEVTPL